MDYMRSGYTVNMQFDAAGEIIVPVTWYACEEGALDFPTPHLYVSTRTWAKHKLPTLGIGERWDSKPVHNDSAPPGFFPGTGGYCGPDDWWQNGCPSDAPPLVIGPNGIPPCCPQPPCQPWRETGIARRSFTLSTPDPPYISVENDANHYDWIFGVSTDNQLFLDEDASGVACGDGPGTTCALILQAYGEEPNMVCLSYDPGSSTGVWGPPAGSPIPADYRVTFHNPP
jgi:hypothetical protein